MPCVSSASGFLPASALSLHEALRPPGATKTRDASDRLLPPERTDVHPFCRTFPIPLESLSRLGTPRDDPRSSRGMTEGTGVFTTPEPLRPRRLEHGSSCLRPRGFRSRAWASSTRGARCIETSDTPVAAASLFALTHLRACSFRLRLLMGLENARGSEDRRMLPRPRPAPARESRRLAMIRGAFHRQGPFVGSGGLYGPGPATAAPLLAMWRPLDDALTPPWALFRSCLRLTEGSRGTIVFSRDAPVDV